MTTIGLRGLLAAGFLISSGVLTGLGSTPGDATAGPDPGLEAGEPDQGLSLVSRIELRSCVVSLGANRRDAANDRRNECENRIAARD